MKSHGKEFIGSIQVKSVGSVPSSGAEGEIVYNTGDNSLYVADGATFEAVGGSGGSPIKTDDPFGDDVLQILCTGVNACMQTHGASVQARVSAYDVITSIHGGVGTLTYAVSRNDSSWTSNTDPKLAYVTFTGEGDLATQIIYVRVTDSKTPTPQVTKVQTYTVVQDNYGLTGGGG